MATGTEGYKTAEDIAVEIGMSAAWVNNVGKELGMQRVVLPGDNRRRYSPQDVERIKERAAKRG
jgi:hypothetical protein